MKSHLHSCRGSKAPCRASQLREPSEQSPSAPSPCSQSAVGDLRSPRPPHLGLTMALSGTGDEARPHAHYVTLSLRLLTCMIETVVLISQACVTDAPHSALEQGRPMGLSSGFHQGSQQWVVGAGNSKEQSLVSPCHQFPHSCTRLHFSPGLPRRWKPPPQLGLAHKLGLDTDRLPGQ